MNSYRYLLQTLHTWRENRIILKDWNYSSEKKMLYLFYVEKQTNFTFHSVIRCRIDLMLSETLNISNDSVWCVV